MSRYVPEPTYEISFLFRRILVPVDGSANSFRALEFALDIAKRYGSKLTVIHVKPKGSSAAENPLDNARKLTEQYGLAADFKLIEIDPEESSIPKAIIDEINSGNYDMVVLGARGKSLSPEINIGSVALSVTLNSTITVVIVR